MGWKTISTYINYYILEGVICAQNGTKIALEFGCPENGEAEICNNRIIGNCFCENVEPTYTATNEPTFIPTVTPTDRYPYTSEPGYCVDGVQVCVRECECQNGYYECQNNRWVVRPLPCII